MNSAKQLWLVPLITALLVAFVGWWADLEVRRTIEREVTEDLQGMLDANVTALEIWMADQKHFVASFAQEPRFKALALELLDRPEPAPADRAFPELGRQQSFSNEHLPERLRLLGFRAAQVVSTNFLVAAEIDAGRGGRARPRTPVPEELRPHFAELFESGQPILVTPFKLREPPGGRRGFGRGGFDPQRLTNNEARGPGFGFGRGPLPPDRGTTNPPPWAVRLREISVMQVAAPIKDDSNVTRGALALRLDPDAEFTRILSVARSGQSGETIAFDSEGLLISRSRFEDKLKELGLIPNLPEASSALALRLQDPGGDLTRGFKHDTNSARGLITLVSRAIKGDPGVGIVPTRDYRGVPVVAAWRWLPDYDFGIATKLDASEAFGSLRLVRSVFIVLFLLLVLTSLVILLFTYLQVVWRRRVTEAELKVRQLGQYKLEEKIGEGGMGTVYRAHHALLRRETALKLLPPDKADPVAIARFEREVRLTCQLTHPNTIQVYDYGHTPDGIFYYAMEYLDGLNLSELIERYGAQPEERVAHILIHICESLNEAHGAGLIHRDIKPANIFVCDRGGVPDCVKVLDFGLVKSFSESEDQKLSSTAVGEIVGTPHFIAPETLRNAANCDVRSDLYSLGALGYFLLTGQNVFVGGSMVEICQKHLTDVPEAPHARAGVAVTPEFEAVILGCLQKDPAQRPQTARDLAAQVAATPRAREWTWECRQTWWIQHRQKLASAPLVHRQPPSTEATVNIALSQRTF